MQASRELILIPDFGNSYAIFGDVVPWADQIKALRLGGKFEGTKLRDGAAFLFKKTGKNVLQKLTEFVNKANQSMGYFVPSATNLVDREGLKYQVMTYMVPQPYVGQKVIFNPYGRGYDYNYVVSEVQTGLDTFINFINVSPTGNMVPKFPARIIDGQWTTARFGQNSNDLINEVIYFL